MQSKLCFVTGGSPVYRQETSLLLRQSGIVPIVLDDAAMTLEACRTMTPEMILIDYPQNKARCLGLLYALRGLPRGHIPMVLVRLQPGMNRAACNVPTYQLNFLRSTEFHNELKFFLDDLPPRPIAINYVN